MIRHHADKTLVSGGFVETKLLLKLLDKAWVNAAGASRVVADLNIGAAHIQTRASHGVGAFKTRQHLINGPPRGGLNDNKIE